MKKFFITLFSVFMLIGCVQNPNTIIQVEYESLETAIVNTIEKVEKSTLCVQVYTVDDLAGSGSGVIYKKQGNTYYVITNEHVVDSGSRFTVSNNIKEYTANLLGYSKDDDIAVLSFETNDYFEPVNIDLQVTLKRGQHVIAIGSPLGIEYYNTCTTGVIGNVTASRIQHDAAINPGNSGGPLFDLTGNLIGINTEKRVWSSNDIPVEGLGFAINIKSVYNLIDKFDDNTKPIQRPVLGITITPLSAYLVSGEDLSFVPKDVTSGIVVVDVLSTGVAYNHIFVNDILITLNGTSLATTNDLRDELYKLVTGEKATFTLYRNKELITIEFIV